MEVVKAPMRTLREAGCALRFHLAPLIGRKRSYEIAAGYRHREDVTYYDDTDNADEWQREVYETARAVMLENGLKTVIDVGCGSGYKLVTILGDFETVGLDLPQTIQQVRRVYRDRKWFISSFEEMDLPKYDLVVCADVIEHVENPDRLICFIKRVAKDWIVLSTPERGLVYGGRGRSRFGPPANPAHVREWSIVEFKRYIDRFIRVERHEISNREQATQMIIGRAHG